MSTVYILYKRLILWTIFNKAYKKMAKLTKKFIYDFDKTVIIIAL